MIKSYLVTGLRNIFRSKLYSLINILGLTLGIACCTLLAMYIIDELKFDDMHEKSDDMYRVIISDDSSQEGVRYYGQTPPPLGPAIKETYPEVTDVVRLWKYVGQLTFIHDGQRFAERSWYLADKNFFQYFNFEFISGDPATALNEPNSIVLTESIARKYFGEEDPMGKSLTEHFTGELKVTGLIKDIPQNSHLQFKILLSQRTEDNWLEYLNRFDRFGTYTYLILERGSAYQNLQDELGQFLETRMGDDAEDLGIILQPLRDIHFNSSNIEFGTDELKGEIKYIYIFLAVGFFILLIASFNYINLATAKSMERGKEIGIRKTAGAHKGQLVFQFLSESILIALISFLLAIGLVDVLMPYFNDISGKSFGFDTDTMPEILGILLSLTLVIGLLSGIFPAIYLSSLKPISMLRKEAISGKKGTVLRRVLVIAQFTLSIFMLIVTAIVYRQLNYMNDFDLGFNKEHLVIVDINNGNVRSNFETMKTEFSKIPEVLNVATSSRVPGEWKDIAEIMIKKEGSQDSLHSFYMAFDEDMVKTYNFSFVSGHNFEGNPKVDSTHIIINETAMKLLDLENDPIGSRLKISNELEFTIIGVVEDFNYQSLHQKVNPLIIGYWNAPIQSIDYFSIRITGNHLQETIKNITKVHEAFDESTPIEYHFLDNQIDMFYQGEQRAGKIFILGAGLTIFLACLGLFGLASYLVQKRTKEIGIRKVMGASVTNLYILISYSFIKQVFLAWIIAIPLGYIVMKKWLTSFEFHIEMSVNAFVVSGLVAMLIALGTVSYRSIRASLRNPSTTLRYE